MEEDGEGFAPRKSLARIPPEGFSSARASSLGLQGEREKRPLGSPEEPPAPKIRMTRRSPTTSVLIPPISGLLTSDAKSAPTTPYASAEDIRGAASAPVTAPVSPMPDHNNTLKTGSKRELVSWAHSAMEGIMESVSCSTSKLNKGEIARIGNCGTQLMATVAALSERISELELAAARQSTNTVVAIEESQQRTYAGALKLKGKEVAIRKQQQGPLIAVYPTEEGTDIKTASETKEELKRSFDPIKMGAQINHFRKVGNAGVLIRTTDEESANIIKANMPRTLNAVEPKKMRPLVAINFIEADLSHEDLLIAMGDQNFKGDKKWTNGTIAEHCKPAFKRRRVGKIPGWWCWTAATR